MYIDYWAPMSLCSPFSQLSFYFTFNLVVWNYHILVITIHSHFVLMESVVLSSSNRLLTLQNVSSRRSHLKRLLNYFGILIVRPQSGECLQRRWDLCQAFRDGREDKLKHKYTNVHNIKVHGILRIYGTNEYGQNVWMALWRTCGRQPSRSFKAKIKHRKFWWG